MSGIQSQNGKAFEYACLSALAQMATNAQAVHIAENAPYFTAQNAFFSSDDAVQAQMHSAAVAAGKALMRLEPQLTYVDTSDSIFLSLQTDAMGISGDVRDVLCVRKQSGWQIGLSCKHNHHAVKHSRLSASIDFGAKWFSVPCSNAYFDAVRPLFLALEDIRKTSIPAPLWGNVFQKEETYYLPVLHAFMDELVRLDVAYPKTIPTGLIRYLIGANDFYKIIADNVRRITRVEAINLEGKLNQPSPARSAIVNTPRLKYPTRFFHVGMRPDSTTTAEVVCDEGWALSFRIHSASSRVEASLKFDINLISLPKTIYAQVEPW
ncbi:MAG: HaeIII family restriction endonuclease [Oscillospiraceae bacterium]|jgi:hypothetical protein|nr:HaeIII family restriction endonuclease [Oscillospiraceae bacterium]